MATVRFSPRVRQLSSLVDLKKREVEDLTVSADSMFRRAMVENFASEGAASQRPWPPLSPRYRDWKMRRRPGRKILQFDGGLRASFVLMIDPAHIAYEYRNPGRGWVIRLGSSHWLAPIHAGKMHKLGNLPVRNPIEMSPAQMNSITTVIARGLVPLVLRRWKAAAALGSA